MNDPWDVKSVRQPGQYVSCIKINGVPLLPPVLSKECRKEMHYYKLLAQEVENRIALLKPYMNDSDSDSGTEKLNPSDTVDAVKTVDEHLEIPEKHVEIDIEDKFFRRPQKTLNTTNFRDPNLDSSISTNQTPSPPLNSPKLIADLNHSINIEKENSLKKLDPPERDWDCSRKLTEEQGISPTKSVQNCKNDSKNVFEFHVNPGSGLHQDKSNSTFASNLQQEGPSSLSTKSFTGSLNDIRTESLKDIPSASHLSRQNSYTILHPSPLLLAHLEVESINTGVEMSSISMSESFSNLASPKKRRIWDLESAKVKWSSMALELNQKNNGNGEKPKHHVARPTSRKMNSQSCTVRARSVAFDRSRRNSMVNQRSPVKNEQATVKNIAKIPEKNTQSNTTSNNNYTTLKHKPADITSTPIKDIKKITKSSTPAEKLHTPVTSTPAESPPKDETDDPATRVTLLYEKIQAQQLMQMAKLVEKQKKEQMLLQQVFEEQNNLLYKQLKTICPKSPIEVKEAWAENAPTDRGPVSLSQLIDQKRPETVNQTLSSTLIDTNNYIYHCNDILKKSKTISNSFKRVAPVANKVKSKEADNSKSLTNNSKIGDSRNKNRISKGLTKNESSPSDKDYEEASLTDHTNDTMADLNFTLTSDDCCEPFLENNDTCVLMQSDNKNPVNKTNGSTCVNEDLLKTPLSVQSKCSNKRPVKKFACKPSPQELAAAATIVAYAKGYLVRRLLRTQRVQGTVQMIRDALLCALQLHQDREGIRGADVGLHRRLIQQITAACYTLHETFVSTTPAERCEMIAADRERRRALASRQSTPLPRRSPNKTTDVMSQSHSGVFPVSTKRWQQIPAAMTQSNYETFSVGENARAPRRRPWR